ncbi:MAG TPA: hypothetical protein DEB31_08325 [Clostridiales bacterium]|nr:hypothetical protein [Clostridiales bacterium]
MKARKKKTGMKGPDKRWLVTNAIIMGILFTVIICAGAFSGIKRVTSQETYAKNMKVNGVELGGLTLEEGEARLIAYQEERLQNIAVPVRYAGHEHVFTAEELGVSSNAQDMARTAFSYNKQGGALLENFTRTFDDVDLVLELTVNEQVLQRNVKAFLSEYVVQAEDAKVVFDEETHSIAVTESREGVTTDMDAVCGLVAARVKSESNSPVTAEEQVQQPDFTTDEVRDNTMLIGECTTQLLDDENRLTNIRLVSDALNGAMIKPGENFSLNALVGQRTEEKGYVRADAFYDGTESSSELGGGACQVATTLYNAALRADLEIVDRARHAFPPGYVELGRDAMLSWDDKDLVLGNKTDYPIYIGVQIAGGELNVKLYGQPIGYDIDIETKKLREISPPGEKVVQSDEYPAGETVVTQAERIGYEVEVYRNYINNDVVVERELISYDYYPEMRRIVAEGTG